MSSIRSRRRVVTALVAALLAGAGTAWATNPEQSPAPSLEQRALPVPVSVAPADGADRGPRRTPAGTAGTPEPSRGAARPAGTPKPARTPARAVSTAQPPTSVVIGRIGVRMPILAVGVASDGQMALPPDPADVGWYRYGPRPGDRAGATVLAAHVDSAEYGIGPMARLDELRDGDVITVLSGATSRRYVVTAARQFEKATLDLASLFARTGPPRLHLITCGGKFDARERHYDQNVVVLAVPDPET